MLIPSIVNEASHFSEPSSSSSFPPSLIASSSANGDSAPSAFEQLLSRQMGVSNLVTPLSQTISGDGSGFQPESNLQFNSNLHAARLASTTSEPAKSALIENSESFSYFAMNGLMSTTTNPWSVGESTAISVATKEVANSNGSPTSSQFNNGSSGETRVASDRISAWQFASDESRFASLAGSLSASAALNDELASFRERVAIQDSSDSVANSGFSISSGLSNGIEDDSQSDNQYFLVNEFSVETTPSTAASRTNSVSGLIAEQPDLGMAMASSVPPNIAAQRQVQKSDPSASAGSEMILTSSALTPSSLGEETPLAEEMSNVVTKQLEEESISGVTTVRIQLERQDLGSISLFLSINNHVVRIRIVAQDELARELIESQMDELRQSLAESDVECSDFQVVCDSSDQNPSDRKRSSQPLIALGFSSSSHKLRTKQDAPKPGSTSGQLNFTA